MENITSAENKSDKFYRAKRLWDFLSKLEAEINPDAQTIDLRKTVHSNLHRLSGHWEFNKENSLGYRLHSSSNSQISNRDAPDSVTMSLTAPIIDDKHLRDIMMSARADAIKDGINLQTDKTVQEFKDYISVIGLVNNNIALPISPDELDQLHNINPDKIRLADENHGKIIRDPKNPKKVMFDPEASFTVHKFMEDKELETQTVGKDVIKFNIGDDTIKHLGNLAYSVRNDSDYFDLVISGTKEQISNLGSVPRYAGEHSEGFNPKQTSVEFTGMPKGIYPSDMADILEDIPGQNKTIRVLLDKDSPTYAEDCKYINNVYKQLMAASPENYTLEVYDNYTANGNKEVFTNTHGPGAAYDETLSNRPQFKLNAEEQKQEISHEPS